LDDFLRFGWLSWRALKELGSLEIKNILFIEPYDGGSHRAFREGLIEHSRHNYKCLTLPARFWKWRMRGSAAWFADEVSLAQPGPCDLLMVTGFLNLADFRGLVPPPFDRLPALLYMHENQLTYPLSPDEEFDFHFGFTNILSCLAADHIVFNSDFHRDLFLTSLPAYLGKMSEAVPRQVPQRLGDRSSVLPVGLDRRPLPSGHYSQYRGGHAEPEVGPGWPRGKRHRILWNHRWEFDKQPEMFARVVNRLLEEGRDFEVALLGEPQQHEGVFSTLKDQLGDRLVAFGYLPGREAYDDMLEISDIVVSCAQQEYFGISVAEAVHAGCYPVLPRDQVYPTLYGTRCKGRHFYEDEEGLVNLLRDLLTGDSCGHICSLDRDVDECCWAQLAPRFDTLIDEVCSRGRLSGGGGTPGHGGHS
jgi:glycosyltransferase involved in cell wall biosynthesis